MPLGDLCKVSTDSSSGMQVDELPGGYCPIGYTHTATTQCTSIASIVLQGSTTGSSGGGFIKMLPANTTSKPTTTQTGNTGGSTGTTGGTSGTTTNTGGTTNTTKTPMKTGTT